MANTAIVTWLLEGDPAIRWQTMRDLQGKTRRAWQAERARTAKEGWGADLLARQDANGGWGGGVYSPKWTSTTYTLLTLCDIGLPGDNAAARRGAAYAVDALLGERVDEAFNRKLADLDRCIVGMMLRIGVTYGLDPARIEAIVDNLLAERMPDAGWNCRKHRRPFPHHSSFHTTLNVLDGLREYIEFGGARLKEAKATEAGALELLAQHRLFRSDHTGNVIRPEFARFAFPPRWHYDAFRALDYFARADAPRDQRLGEAIDLLRERRHKDGCWRIQYKYSGRVFLDMEKRGVPSRWNTFRALRILRWWEQRAAQPTPGSDIHRPGGEYRFRDTLENLNMAELKTQKTEASVDDFLNGIADEQRRKDCVAVLALMKAATKAEPKMWGSSIVGLGQRHYRYASGREGDWFTLGFSPRKDALTLYLAGGVEAHAALLAKLGKHKTGKGCLYIKRLDEIHLPTLKALLKAAVAAAKNS